MTGLLWLATALFAWCSLYQAIQAYVTRPPLAGELATLTGRIQRVDTPVPRNKLTPFSELVIEVVPARVVRAVVRHESLSRAALEAFEGRQAVAKFAGQRPRNRWVYDLAIDGRTVLAFADEAGRDAAVRSDAVWAALGFGALAATSFAGIVLRRRRGGTGER